MLVQNTNKEITCLGKPSPRLGDLLKDIFNITSPERCLFVGDALREDIGFGLSCGFQTLFIMTNTQEELQTVKPENKPHYIADTLGDFVKFFEST